ncbi:MAG: cyanophycinase [Gammaproteobacteria bacterium]|nr:cyanophycinase [Gammaproteobacteria bacterium]MDH3535091.1 cyanophycinase [Gammaproteobacteria bacterium]
MSPSPHHEDRARGYVVPIGGAEERTGSMRVLRRFVKLCGGRRANIVIIPTASQLADTGDRYIEVFKKIGVANAISLPIGERADAERDEYIEHLDGASGIFMTGGNQLRLSTILGGTLVAQKVRRLNAAGVHVAGTSAGAAIMPEHMIAGGSMGLSARADGVNLAPGLGLTNALIIDQHFSQRDRLGRLLTAVSYNPFLLGVGIDEDTAIFISPDRVFEVEGSGNVTIIDPEHLSYSSMDRAKKNESLSLLDLKLHILSKGCRFDIHERKPYPPK